MRAAIVDSSALVALLIENDADHDKAVAIGQTLREAASLILMPSEVIAETLNLLGKMQGRTFAFAAGQQLLNDPDIHLLTASSDRMRAALTSWQKQGSGVSYTDCLVMAAADEAETTIVYGFDGVFAKNGYRLPEAEERAAA
jgi:predicted nucleic acid-binding protein